MTDPTISKTKFVLITGEYTFPLLHNVTIMNLILSSYCGAESSCQNSECFNQSGGGKCRTEDEKIKILYLFTILGRCHTDVSLILCSYDAFTQTSLACSDSQELSTMVSFSLYHRPWGIRKQLLDRVEQPITYFDPSKNGKTNIPSKLAF